MSVPSDEQAALWRSMEAGYSDSPIHKVLGLSLSVKGAGEVEVTFDGRPDAGNRRGNIAGGALAQMIDSAVVQACRTLIAAADKVATLELKVNYVRPGQPGVALRTHAAIDYLGRSTAVGVGRVFDPAGELVAMGIVTVSVRREKTA